MSKICLSCGCEIPAGRLKALPSTRQCTDCSTTQPVAGFMSWEHKTAPVLNLCSQDTAEEVRKMTMRHGGQGVSLGVKFKQ